MKASIEVKDKEEREALLRAMADPTCRAAVVMLGHLLALPTDLARQRVLRHVADKLQEDQVTPEGGRLCRPSDAGRVKQRQHARGC